MANTLTGLISDIYTALDVVSRELVGLIPAVTMEPSLARAAKGQTITLFKAPASTAADITPAVNAPDTGDQTIAAETLTISKSRGVPIRWNAEESLELGASFGRARIQQDQIQQGIRTLTNEVEVDLAALQVDFSRAYGTAAATPFGTAGDFTDATNVAKILKDNGAPMGDAQLVMNTAAGANFTGKQASVEIAGTDVIQRQGVLLTTSGLALRESAQIETDTAGTGSSATTDNAGYAVGATTLTLASAGTGTILAGDIVTFAGDTNKYVVATGDADVSNGGTIVLNEPGLRVAMSAATKAITVIATSARNMAFARSAIVLVTRLPALPEEGDMADDRITIVDPRSGLAMELALYKQYRQVHYELGLSWGQKVVKKEHTALLIG